MSLLYPEYPNFLNKESNEFLKKTFMERLRNPPLCNDREFQNRPNLGRWVLYLFEPSKKWIYVDDTNVFKSFISKKKNFVFHGQEYPYTNYADVVDDFVECTGRGINSHLPFDSRNMDCYTSVRTNGVVESCWSFNHITHENSEYYLQLSRVILHFYEFLDFIKKLNSKFNHTATGKVFLGIKNASSLRIWNEKEHLPSKNCPEQNILIEKDYGGTSEEELTYGVYERIMNKFDYDEYTCYRGSVFDHSTLK